MSIKEINSTLEELHINLRFSGTIFNWQDNSFGVFIGAADRNIFVIDVRCGAGDVVYKFALCETPTEPVRSTLIDSTVMPENVFYAELAQQIYDSVSEEARLRLQQHCMADGQSKPNP